MAQLISWKTVILLVLAPIVVYLVRRNLEALQIWWSHRTTQCKNVQDSLDIIKQNQQQTSQTDRTTAQNDAAQADRLLQE